MRKKPAPRPLERTFDPPKKVLPPSKPKKKAPVWMDYKGEDMRQLTELSGRKVLLVFTLRGAARPWITSKR